MADLRGAPGTRPPWGSKFFHFHAGFGRKNRLAPPLWELAPPWGKSWIRHCLTCYFYLKNFDRIKRQFGHFQQKLYHSIRSLLTCCSKVWFNVSILIGTLDLYCKYNAQILKQLLNNSDKMTARRKFTKMFVKK